MDQLKLKEEPQLAQLINEELDKIKERLVYLDKLLDAELVVAKQKVKAFEDLLKLYGIEPDKGPYHEEPTEKTNTLYSPSDDYPEKFRTKLQKLINGQPERWDEIDLHRKVAYALYKLGRGDVHAIAKEIWSNSKVTKAPIAVIADSCRGVISKLFKLGLIRCANIVASPRSRIYYLSHDYAPPAPKVISKPSKDEMEVVLNKDLITGTLEADPSFEQQVITCNSCDGRFPLVKFKIKTHPTDYVKALNSRVSVECPNCQGIKHLNSALFAFNEKGNG